MNQQLTTLLRKRKTIVLVILVLGIVIIGLIWQFGQLGMKEKEGEPSAGLSNKDVILFEGEPSALFSVEQTAKLGTLEINVYNVEESSYSALELDENYQRIIKRYLAVQIKVFNPSNDKTENLLIGLMDDRGNKYNLDPAVSSYVPDLKEFGRNMNIYPRIIQEGYIFFSNVDERATEVQLIFAVTSTKEKITAKTKTPNINPLLPIPQLEFIGL